MMAVATEQCESGVHFANSAQLGRASAATLADATRIALTACGAGQLATSETKCILCGTHDTAMALVRYRWTRERRSFCVRECS